METPERNEQRDIAVFQEARTVWLAVTPDNTVRAFSTEAAACAYQRHWRRAHGLDPITGVPVSAE